MQSMDTEEVAMVAEKMDEENRLLKIITVTREKECWTVSNGLYRSMSKS